MPIEGPLKELGIHDVFQLLDLSRKTGILRVTSQLRRNQGTVHFDDGAVVYAEVRTNPHRIGQLLVRSGKITEADLQRARDMQDGGDGRRLGEILVDLGVLTRRELERQVRFQIEEVIFEVMSWHEGYFSFIEGPLEEGMETPVRIPTEALLMEGARRIDEWSRIERQIPHLGVVPALAPTAAGGEGELDLLPPEWEVLAMIDGGRDLRDIAQELGRSEFDVAKTVFGLQSAGVLQVADPGTRSSGTADEFVDLGVQLAQVRELLAAGRLEDARAEAEAAAVMHPAEAGGFVALARVHLAAAHPRDADDAARRALRLDPLHAPAHRLLGDALAARGRFGDAVEAWTRWLTIEREDDPDAAQEEAVRAAIEAATRLDRFLRSSHGR